jgi:hypothetical protein
MFCSLQAEQNYDRDEDTQNIPPPADFDRIFHRLLSSSRMLSIYIMPFVRCSTMRSYQLDLDTKQNTSLTCGKQLLLNHHPVLFLIHTLCRPLEHRARSNGKRQRAMRTFSFGRMHENALLHLHQHNRSDSDCNHRIYQP